MKYIILPFLIIIELLSNRVGAKVTALNTENYESVIS